MSASASRGRPPTKLAAMTLQDEWQRRASLPPFSREFKIPSDGALVSYPDHSIPGVYADVRFPNGRNGRVTVDATFPVPPGMGRRAIRLRVWLLRSHLRFVATRGRGAVELDQLARRVYSLLVEAVPGSRAFGEDVAPERRTVVWLPSHGGTTAPPIMARIRIGRADMLALDRALNDATYRRAFRFLLRAVLIHELLDWSVKLPRGTALQTWPVRRALPLAFDLAREMVRAAEHDESLGDRLAEALEGDATCAAYRKRYNVTDEQQAMAAAVALVERAFRGAWGRLRSPITMTPQNALRRYAYGRRSKPYRDSVRDATGHERRMAEAVGVDPDDTDAKMATFRRAFAERLLLAPRPGAWRPTPARRPR